jgi:hypothetical protein
LRATIDERKKSADSFGPQRTTPELVPFTSDQDRGKSRARCDCKLEIFNLGLGGFISTSTGVVQKQQ